MSICSIEKANGALNKMIQEQRLHELVSVTIDEAHMLADPNRCACSNQVCVCVRACACDCVCAVRTVMAAVWLPPGMLVQPMTQLPRCLSEAAVATLTVCWLALQLAARDNGCAPLC